MTKREIEVEIQYNEYIVKKLSPRRKLRTELFGEEQFAKLTIAANHLSWLYSYQNNDEKSELYANMYNELYMEMLGAKSKYSKEEQMRFLKIID